MARIKPESRQSRRNADINSPYEHEHFPKWLYGVTEEGKQVSCLVESHEEFLKALEDGWAESPAELPESGKAPADPAAEQLRKENEELKAQIAQLRGETKAAAQKGDAKKKAQKGDAKKKAQKGDSGE